MNFIIWMVFVCLWISNVCESASVTPTQADEIDPHYFGSRCYFCYSDYIKLVSANMVGNSVFPDGQNTYQ